MTCDSEDSQLEKVLQNFTEFGDKKHWYKLKVELSLTELQTPSFSSFLSFLSFPSSPPPVKT